MKALKKFLALSFVCCLLCIILPFTALADETDEFDPDSLVPEWACTGTSKAKMQAEAGQTLQMASYMYNNNHSSKWVWTSSKKSVASFTKKNGIGTLKTKKAGKTTITLTYKKKKYTCVLTVKKKGSIIKGKYKTFSKAQDTLYKYRKTKITAKNFAKIADAVTTFEKTYEKLMDNGYSDNGTYEGGKKIYVPVKDSNLSSDIFISLNHFAEKQMKKSLKISGLTAGTKKGTVVLTLSKKVTPAQVSYIEFIRKAGDLSSFARHAYIYKIDGLAAKLAELTAGGKTEAEALEELAEDSLKDRTEAYVGFSFAKNSADVSVALTDDSDKACEITTDCIIQFDTASDVFTNAESYFAVK